MPHALSPASGHSSSPVSWDRRLPYLENIDHPSLPERAGMKTRVSTVQVAADRVNVPCQPSRGPSSRWTPSLSCLGNATREPLRHGLCGMVAQPRAQQGPRSQVHATPHLVERVRPRPSEIPSSCQCHAHSSSALSQGHRRDALVHAAAWNHPERPSRRKMRHLSSARATSSGILSCSIRRGPLWSGEHRAR